ncbi:hypothetical protein AQBE111736_13685 [Aquirufa beregesia]
MEAVATPLVKVKLVAVPKSVLATVGAVAGLDELAAPENIMDLLPVYPVAVLPETSLAVMVMV